MYIRGSVMIFKEKLKKVYDNGLLFYILPLVVLGSWLLIMVLDNRITPVRGYYLIHYLYTYGHGFVARGLVGEIISLFTDTVTEQVTYSVVLGFSVLLLAASVLCIGNALNKVKGDKTRFLWTAGLIIVLCLLPFSLRTYFTTVKLDKILWTLTLFAVFLSDKKAGIWFVPVLCVLATLVNPVFLFCSMILVSVILLQKFYDSDRKVKTGVICAVSYGAMIFIGLYGALSESKLGFSNVTEMIEYYFARNAGGLPEEMDRFQTEWLFDYFEPLDRVFKLAYEIYFKKWGNGTTVILNAVFAAVPVYSALTIFWIKAIRAEKNRFQKFIFFLCAVSPAVLIFPVVISWESSKYFGNNVTVQLCLIVFYVVNNNASVMTALGKVREWFGRNILAGSFIVIYFASLMG